MSSKKQSPYDWRELASCASNKKTRKLPTSWRAKFRKVWVWTRRLAAVAILCGLGYGAYYVYENTYVEDFFGVDSPQIGKIEFKSDGVITPAWLSAYLKIPRKSRMADVNIFALKQSLEALTQVKSASVERAYPDTLRVVISEHKPMLRFYAKVDYSTRIYIMSPEGAFFEPVCMNASFVEKLPVIEGYYPDFDGGVPKKFKRAAILEEFLAYVQAKPMKGLENIEAVNVRELGSITLPLISVRTRDNTTIIFAPKDYPKQLDRLEYVLRYSAEKSLNHIDRIDLSLKDRADVKYSDTKSK